MGNSTKEITYFKNKLQKSDSKRITIFLFFIFLLSGQSIYAQFETGRTYNISARSTGKFLNGRKSAGLEFNFTNTSNQSEWYIIDNGDGTFKLESKYSSTSDVLTMSSSTEGVALTTSTWDGDDDQKWILTKSEGFYVLENKNTGLVVTVDDDYPDDPHADPDSAYYDLFNQIGFAVGRTYNSELRQQFEIEPVRDSMVEILATPLTGWKTSADKRALLVLNTQPSTTPTFTVKSVDDGSTILSGNATLAESDTTLTWSQFYYYIDLSSITTEGRYELTSSGYTTLFDVRDDVYSQLNYSKGGTLTYEKIFDGFWKYNSYYDQVHTLEEAVLHEDASGNEYFDVLGTYYDLQPYGWFDAHSRDSKTARTAQALANMMLAYDLVSDNSNKIELLKVIRYGLYNLLYTQNDDGTWPTGKVRENLELYYWAINVDVNTVARAVKALAMGYDLYKDADTEFADSLLDAALAGWAFVVAEDNGVPHWEDSAYVQYEVEYRGKTEDVLTAAIELAFVTNETEYYDFADTMLMQAKFSLGKFVKATGDWPAENSNRFTELGDAVIPFILRYMEIARNQDIKDQIAEIVNQFGDYWKGMQTTVYGVPDLFVSRTTLFGNMPGIIAYAFNMFAIADYLNDNDAYDQAFNALNLLVGANAFGTSYYVGIGDTLNMPGVNFLKRSYENGVGAFLPGFTCSPATAHLTINFATYYFTEGVVPYSSMAFYIFEGFDRFTIPQSPVAGDLKINEIKSNPDGTNTANYVEIYNTSDHKIDLSDVYLEHFRDDESKGSVAFSGVVESNGYVVVARTDTGFNNVFGFDPDFVFSKIYITNTANGFMLRTSTDTLDYCSDVPSPMENTFTVNHIYIRKGYDNTGEDLANDWYDAGTDINGTPGASNNVYWDRVTDVYTCKDSYLWDLNNIIYTLSGTYYDTISNVYGVDSVLTLNLTIVDKTVTVTHFELKANDTTVQSYQWLDCDNDYAPISGETNQIFEPSADGTYAVELITDGCSVISEPQTFVKHEPVWYVSTTGDDSGDGTITDPFATIQYASKQTLPGDTVYVRGGTYQNPDFGDGDIWEGEKQSYITADGAEDYYIVFTPYQDEDVTIEFDGVYGFYIGSASYLKIMGFEFKGIADQITQQEAEDAWGLYKDTDGKVYDLESEMGIDITDPSLVDTDVSKDINADITKPTYYNGRAIVANKSHHIEILNNIVRDAPASAIRAQQCDYITIANNEVYHNTYWTTLGVGAITVAESNVLPEGDTYQGVKIKLINNKVYENENRMYSWNPTKDFVHFAIDEGTGLFLTRNNETYTHGKTLIANNFSYLNGASGIVCHYTNDVIIEQNTVYDNGTTNTGLPGGIGVNTSDSVWIRNNISYSKPDKWALGILAEPVTNLFVDSNVIFNENGTEDVDNNIPNGWVEADPMFLDTSTYDLRIVYGSPAIDNGTSETTQTTDYFGNARDDGSPDIGAHELLPVTSIDIQGEGGVSEITTDDGTLQMIVTLLPSEVTYPDYTVTLINQTGSAIIDDNYLLTAVSNGEVLVKVSTDVGDFKDSVTITLTNQKVTFTTTADGDWTTDSIWTPVPPQNGPAGVDVIIKNNVSIDVDNFSLTSIDIRFGDTVSVESATNINFGNVIGTGVLKFDSENIPAGDYTVFASSSGGSFDFAGTSDYVLPNTFTQANNLLFSGSGQITLPDADIMLNGKMVIDGESTLKVVLPSSRTIGVSKNFKIVTGQFEAGAGSLINFCGSSLQKIYGRFDGVNALSNIKIDNPSGITIYNFMDVKETVTFVEGIITVVEGKTLDILNTANDAVSGASDASHIFGTLNKTIPAASSFIFPVGDATKMYSIGISSCNYTSETESVWTGEYLGLQDINSINSADGLESVISEAKWALGCPVEAQGKVTVEMNGFSSLDGKDDSYLRVVKLIDGAWSSVGNTGVTGDNSNGTISSQDTVKFSYQTFSVGSSSTVLPVELSDFKATFNYDNKSVNVYWTTASEQNNDYFEIQRSFDAVNYTTIGKVQGSGNTLEQKYYSFIDYNPQPGLDYYRLKQVDFDGTETISKPVSIEYNTGISGNLQDIIIYPNPYNAGSLTISLSGVIQSGNIRLTITDMSGKEVLNKEIIDIDGNRIDLIPGIIDNLNQGIYIIMINTESQSIYKKMIVE